MLKLNYTSFGFTLLEMIVAIALFSVVVLIGVSSLFSIFGGLDKAHSSSVAINNIGILFEEMSRAIHNGFFYHCDIADTSPPIDKPNDCGFTFGAASDSIVFEDIGGDLNSPADQIVYRFVEVSGLGFIEKSIDSGVNYERITPNDVDVDLLLFHVRGSGNVDNIQSRVLIILQGVSGMGTETSTKFELQTTITQRAADG